MTVLYAIIALLILISSSLETMGDIMVKWNSIAYKRLNIFIFFSLNLSRVGG